MKSPQRTWMIFGFVILAAGVLATMIMSIILLTKPPAASPSIAAVSTAGTQPPHTTMTSGVTTGSTTAPLPSVYSSSLQDTSHSWPTNIAGINTLKQNYQKNLTTYVQVKYPGSQAQVVNMTQMSSSGSGMVFAMGGIYVQYTVSVPANAGSTPAAVTQSVQNGVSTNNLSWTVQPVSQVSGPTPQPTTTTVTSTTTTSTVKPTTKTTTTPPPVQWSRGFIDAAEMLKSGIDSTVDPCVDFYQHACGKWNANNPPTPSTPRQSTFGNLNRQVLRNISSILMNTQTSVQNKWPKSVQTAALIHKTCVGSYQNPQSNITNGNTMLQSINMITNNVGWPMISQGFSYNSAQIEKLMGDLSHHGIQTLITAYVDADWKSPNQYALYLDQATLAMDRRFFIDPLFGDIRQSYYNMIVNVATMLANDTNKLQGNVNVTTIQNDALAILNFETSLARRTVPVTERRVFSSQFNSYNLSSLVTRWPLIQWYSYLPTLLTIKNSDYLNSLSNDSQWIVINQPGFIDEMHGNLLSSVAKAGGKVEINYLVWRWVYANLQFFPGPYRSAFEGFQLTLNQATAMPPATEMCASMLVQYMPFATGFVYKTYFHNTQTDNDVRIMAQSVLDNFSTMLSGLSWLDGSSKVNAQAKKAKVTKNVAYPAWLNNPANLDAMNNFTITTILQNTARAHDLLSQSWYMTLGYWNNQFKLLSQKVDKSIWLASPAMVNAWYQPSLNSITFPAAIMNPPFYRLDFPSAVKYGGFGVVMGHELSHGFDDEGSQFDQNGQLNPIYSVNSSAEFQNMASCVISEYNQFCYPSQELNLCIDGKNTQGENIADNAGVLASYQAYQTWVSLNGKEPHLPGLENYSSNQIFFLSFAHLFCGTQSPGSLVQQLVVDPHSPGRYRIIGSIVNSDNFGVAFNCPRNRPMLPPASQQCPVYRQPGVPATPPTTMQTPPMPPKNSQGWSDAAAIINNGLDTTVNPCQDFYHYACNNWIKSHPLQSHQSRTSAFGLAQTRVLDQLMTDLHNTNLNTAPKTIAAGYNFYESCVQASASNNPYGANVLLAMQSDLQTTWPIGQSVGMFQVPNNGANNPTAFNQWVWKSVAMMDSFYSTPTFLSSYVTVDYKKVSRNALYIDQGSVGLGSRDFYLKPQFQPVLQSYQQLIVSVAMTLINETNLSNRTTAQIMQDAHDIVQFETLLASAIVPGDQLNNYTNMFNEYNISGLMTTYSSIDWVDYLTQHLGLHVPLNVIQDRFVLTLPKYVSALNGLIAATNPRTIVNYLGWRFFFDNLMFIGPNYRIAYLELLKTRDGVQALPPSGHSCIGMLMGYMPFGTGRLYIQNYPNLQAIRTDIAFQTRRIVYSFQQMLNSLPWMDDNSKRLANRKAAGLIQNDLYPDWILNDKQLDAFHATYIVALTSSNGSAFFANYRWMKYSRGNAMLRTLVQPANRREFLESPALVNAWYQPERNSITFPLGILQPPYYRLDFPQAFNYGGQGATAGHELSHGFDNSGVQFFTNGTLQTWMSPKSQTGFSNMANCVINQYNNYCYPNLQLCIKGKVTQGENIADIAGIRAAYYAYQDYTSYYGPEPPLPGLTNYTMNQIFFIAYAHGWCSAQTNQALTNQLVLDVHSPAKWRVNGVLADMPEFAQAFNCPVGSVAAPKNSCTVW